MRTMKLQNITPLVIRFLNPAADWLQSVFLLIFRLVWGSHFAQTGWGKLNSIDNVTSFFTDLGIPFPKLNAIMAGSTECFGGVLLVLGLAGRLISVPLAFTMLVAYATADKEAVQALFSDFDQFVKATPFPFLVAVLMVFVFGPGKISLDKLIQSRLAPQSA
jgi:putative oxidoreductase